MASSPSSSRPIAFYAVAIALSLWNAWLALMIYVLVAIMWVIPDRRLEK